MTRPPPTSTLFPYTTLFRSINKDGVKLLREVIFADKKVDDGEKKFLTRIKKALTRTNRSEEHTSELQSHSDLVCRLLLEKKKQTRSDPGRRRAARHSRRRVE